MAKPRKHVFVCTQHRPEGHPRGSCAEKGCRDVWQRFSLAFDQQQLFGEIGLVNTGCLGPCAYGTNVLIYPDAVMYSNVTAADVDEIIESHIKNDTPVERLKVAPEVWG